MCRSATIQSRSPSGSALSRRGASWPGRGRARRARAAAAAKLCGSADSARSPALALAVVVVLGEAQQRGGRQLGLLAQARRRRRSPLRRRPPRARRGRGRRGRGRRSPPRSAAAPARLRRGACARARDRVARSAATGRPASGFVRRKTSSQSGSARERPHDRAGQRPLARPPLEHDELGACRPGWKSSRSTPGGDRPGSRRAGARPRPPRWPPRWRRARRCGPSSRSRCALPGG